MSDWRRVWGSEAAADEDESTGGDEIVEQSTHGSSSSRRGVLVPSESQMIQWFKHRNGDDGDVKHVLLRHICEMIPYVRLYGKESSGEFWSECMMWTGEVFDACDVDDSDVYCWARAIISHVSSCLDVLQQVGMINRLKLLMVKAQSFMRKMCRTWGTDRPFFSRPGFAGVQNVRRIMQFEEDMTILMRVLSEMLEESSLRGSSSNMIVFQNVMEYFARRDLPEFKACFRKKMEDEKVTVEFRNIRVQDSYFYFEDLEVYENEESGPSSSHHHHHHPSPSAPHPPPSSSSSSSHHHHSQPSSSSHHNQGMETVMMVVCMNLSPFFFQV
jgi:hypothetical protein